MSEAATIDIPKIGKVQKDYVIGGVALVVGIVGYAYWRNRQDSAAAAAAAPTPAPPVGDYVDPSGGTVSSASTSTSGVDSGQVLTNAQWEQHALDLLAQYTSTDTGAASVALSAWLAGQGLTPDQKTIVTTARGLAGRLPDLSPWGGVEPPMKDALPSPSPTPDPGTGSPAPLGPPGGLRVDRVQNGAITFRWNPVPGATGYVVRWRDGKTTTEANGKAWTQERQVSDTSDTIPTSAPGRQYNYQVRTLPSDNQWSSVWATSK